MYLSALVVAVMRSAAVVDHAQRAVFKLHHYNGGVHIAVLVVARAGKRRAVCGDFGHFATGQIADHIEIMDGHVHEDAARNLDIVHGLMVGVARGDLDDVGLAQTAGGNRVAHHFVVVVEAAVEANLELNALRS